MNKPKVPKAGEKYRHFKGGNYIVIDIAKHSETLEEMVIYKKFETGETWVRPLSLWMLPKDGQPRFQKIG